MKIIIIGAGVSGLATYLLLRKHVTPSIEPLTIIIYEAYDIHKLDMHVKPLSEADNDEPVFTPSAIGNALGIGRNGLSVLHRLDTNGNIFPALRSRGNPIQSWRMSNARGWTLANASMLTQSADQTTKKSTSGFEEDGMLMIARQDLWEVLRDEVIKDCADAVVMKRVNRIVIGDRNVNSVVHFEDGTADEADLVIGADGLRSVVRIAMFNQQDLKNEEILSNASHWSWSGRRDTGKASHSPDYITPVYEGLGGFGGFIPTTELQRDSNFDPQQMNIVFGPNGFFGYGCTSSAPAVVTGNEPVKPDTGTVSAWWSTFSSPNPYPYRKQVSSTKTTQSETRNERLYEFDKENALAELLRRHRAWKNPAIQSILDHVSADSSSGGLSASQYYPTWTTPELPRWSQSGRAVLIGDAAHALPPSSGQGVSQAFEDCEALVLLLKHYLSDRGVSPSAATVAADPTTSSKDGTHKESDDIDALTATLSKFEALRKPRVKMIFERAKKYGGAKSDMGFVMEMVVYFFVWLVGKIHDKYNDMLLDYDLPAEVEKIIKSGD